MHNTTILPFSCFLQLEQTKSMLADWAPSQHQQ